jgi:hypothetical protein
MAFTCPGDENSLRGINPDFFYGWVPDELGDWTEYNIWIHVFHVGKLGEL